MTAYRYPLSALAGDYARAGAGLVLTGTPLILVPLNIYVAGVCAALAALFAAFGGLTVLRHLRAIEVGEAGIAARGPFPVLVRWEALEGVALRYYATRRDGASGWMELVLRGAGHRVMLDSRIEGFSDIAARVSSVAQRRHLPVTPATAANFAALGIPLQTAPGE